ADRYGDELCLSVDEATIIVGSEGRAEEPPSQGRVERPPSAFPGRTERQRVEGHALSLREADRALSAAAMDVDSPSGRKDDGGRAAALHVDVGQATAVVFFEVRLSRARWNSCDERVGHELVEVDDGHPRVLRRRMSDDGQASTRVGHVAIGRRKEGVELAIFD